MVSIAAAPFVQPDWLHNADFIFFMEKSPDDVFQRQISVSQFIDRYRVRKDADMFPFRMVMAHMEPFPPHFPLGQMLQQQAARNITRKAGADKAGNLF